MSRIFGKARSVTASRELLGCPAYAALKGWGLPYLMRAITGIDGQPSGIAVLNVQMRPSLTRVELQQDSDLEKAESEFQNICRNCELEAAEW
jgi:hypothetical protein